MVLLNVMVTCTGSPTGDFVFFLEASPGAPFTVSSNSMVTLRNTSHLWGVGLEPHTGMASERERCVCGV